MSAASAPASRRRAAWLPCQPVLAARSRGPAGSGQAARDRGSLTLMLAVLFVALLALSGLVVDGGAKLDADQKAMAIAQEAARAGAGMVNVPKAYSGGPFTVSPGQAVAAARMFLAAGGYPGTVSLVGNDAIKVTVTVRQPTRMLSLIGINSFTVRESATAMLVSGVTGPGR